MSIPQHLRPGESVQLHNISPTLSKILLHQHFSYYSVLTALSRLSVHLGESDAQRSLVRAARQVLELTRFIDTKAYCPLW
jgi:hypothetical protein